jgi:RHS repeat-associated protein
VAPALDPSVASRIEDQVSFLFEGDDPIQRGVLPGAIEARRMSVLRGRVVDEDGEPLAGVKIQVLRHGELGYTATREDGRYDLVVNGGGTLVVSYSLPGMLSIQRTYEAPWRGWVELLDVALIALDAQATEVVLGGSAASAVRGSRVADRDGARQATLVVPAGQQAELLLPDGRRQAASRLTLRATEFTLGERGPARMPGVLPPQVAYTYAVELTADEAEGVEARGVAFSKPIPFYVENFLGYAVGTRVPLGSYDRERGVWVPEKSGRVIAVLRVAGGLAEVDVDGDGAADGGAALAELGLTDEERRKLAELYPGGASLWRVELEHFSIFDCNWSMWPPEGAAAPDGTPGTPPPALCPYGDAGGSVIHCQDQVLGEDLPLVGLPFGLHYRSDRVPGRLADRSLDIPLRGPVVHPMMKGIELEVNVAGQVFRRHFEPDPVPGSDWDFFRYTWDGKDAYGRELQGRQRLDLRLGYTYPMVRTAPEVFGDYAADDLTRDPTREDATLWMLWTGAVGAFDVRPLGLGGWTLGVHHVYDPVGKVLLLGTGERREVERLPPLIETAAGNGGRSWQEAMEGLPATEAAIGDPRDVAVDPEGNLYLVAWPRVFKVAANGGQIVTVAGGGSEPPRDGMRAVEASLFQPEGLDVGPDGSVYIAETAGNRVLQVTPDGRLHVVAGTGESGYAGDGGPARAARLNRPADVALAPDGSLYVADQDNCVIRKIDTAGGIRTAAGQAGVCGASGDGGPALEATLAWPSFLAAGPDGSLYLSESWDSQVRRIDPGGRIARVAGPGESGDEEDERPGVDFPTGLAVDRDGTLYVADESLALVMRVSADGTISTLAGTGESGYAGDGGPAGEAELGPVQGLAVDPQGNVLVADWQGSSRVRRVRPVSFAQAETGDYLFPSQDGSEVYLFGPEGRHRATLSALTGASLWAFEYDQAGRLSRLVDADGDTTVIERDGAGNPTAIRPPFGPATLLELGADGHLASLTDPAGGRTRLTCSDQGLLTGLIDPRGGVHAFSYDAHGYLVRDDDPAGGFKRLERTERPEAGEFTTLMTSAEGRTKAYDVRQTTAGDSLYTLTFPSGVVNRVRQERDGKRRVELGDGRTLASRPAGDPRFGVLVERVGEATLGTPAGLVMEYQAVRQKQGGASSDPMDFTVLRTEETLNGKTWVTSYAKESRTFETQSPEGRVARTTLDEKGRVVRREWPGSDLHPVRFEYDAYGRLVRALQGEGSGERAVSLGWDANGQLESLGDPLGREVGFVRDANGRVTRQVLPDGRVIGLAWDAHGNASSVTPPGRPAHGMTYTPVDLMESYDPPEVDGLAEDRTRWAYDRDRKLVRLTRPDGGQIELTLDPGGRVDVLTHPDGQVDFDYEVSSGLPRQIATSDGVDLGYSWDGILPLEEVLSGPFQLGFLRSYSNDLMLESLRLGARPALGFGYDRDGLLVSAGALSLQREPATGRVTGTALGRVSTAQAHDRFGGLLRAEAAFQGGALYSADYARDKLGRIVRKDEVIQGERRTFEYDYDLAGRLVEVVENGAVSTSYEYDPNGNRLRLRRTGEPDQAATYDDQDRMLSYGDATYRYTAAGELQSKAEGGEVTTYRYDALGNLRLVILPDGRELEYQVDGRNRRVAKVVDGVLERGWIWLDPLKPLAEVDGDGQVLSEFIYAGGVNVPDAMLRDGQTYRLVKDHLGSVRLVVNAATGEVAQRIDYGPWGEVLLDTNPGFQPFGFAGGLHDPDTGLTRFGARDYDPETGRWTAKDPIGFGGGSPNHFLYVMNDPLNWFDPAGRCSEKTESTISSGVGAAFSIAATLISIPVSIVAAISYFAGQTIATYTDIDEYGGDLLYAWDPLCLNTPCKEAAEETRRIGEEWHARRDAERQAEWDRTRSVILAVWRWPEW